MTRRAALLAAINFVESAFGRLRNSSAAGARVRVRGGTRRITFP